MENNLLYKGMMPSVPSIVIGIVKKFSRVNKADKIVYLADIVVLPQEWELSNVRQLSGLAGGDISVVSNLNPNDVVLVALINDSISDPVIIGRLWHSKKTIPTYSDGDAVIEHQSGTTINIANNGDVTIVPATGQKVYLGSATGTKSVVLDGDTVAGHTHTVTGVEPGAGSVTTSSATSTVVASSTKTAAS